MPTTKLREAVFALSTGTPAVADFISYVKSDGTLMKNVTLTTLAGIVGGTGAPGGTDGQLQYKSGAAFAGFGSTDGNGLNLSFTNPLISGTSSYLFGMNLSTTFDSSQVDPGFANLSGLANQIVFRHGANLYGGGTNSKQSVFNEYNLLDAYGAGQRFNAAYNLNNYGMGDDFTWSVQHTSWGGVSAQGDEGTSLLTSNLVHGSVLWQTTISSIATPATVDTTLTATVTASKTAQTVSVGSSSGVIAGQWITVGGGITYQADGNIEAVHVTAVGAGTITGIFRSNHSSGETVKPATVLTVGDASGFGQMRPIINKSASPYATGTATVATSNSGQVDGSGGASWTVSMVGGNATIPGYISFEDDDFTLPNADVLKAWYPIIAVDSTTQMHLIRRNAVGASGYIGHAVGVASNYTIRPGARMLEYVGSGVCVLEYNTFTWTVGNTIESAFSVNNDWAGMYLRLAPTVAGGEYRAGIHMVNNGNEPVSAGLILDFSSYTGDGNPFGSAIYSNGASTGMRLINSTVNIIRCDKFSADGDGGTDLHWTMDGGNGISVGPNFHLGDGQHNLVIATMANDSGSGEGNSWDSGIEDNNGVLSMYHGAPSVMRWNGDFNLNGLMLVNDSGTFKIESSSFPLRTTRLTSSTNSINANTIVKLKSSGDMADGFGPLLNFSIEDTAAVENFIGLIAVVRDGADNSGKMLFQTYNAGTNTTQFSISSAGIITIANLPTSSAGLSTGQLWNSSGVVHVA